MGIEVKPGNWRQRDGRIAVVQFADLRDIWPWKGTDANGEPNSWRHDGHCLIRKYPDYCDLIAYLGPAAEDAAVKPVQE